MSKYKEETLIKLAKFFSTKGFEAIQKGFVEKTKVLDKMIASTTKGGLENVSKGLIQENPERAEALARLVKYRMRKGEHPRDVLKRIKQNVEDKHFKRELVQDSSIFRDGVTADAAKRKAEYDSYGKQVDDAYNSAKDAINGIKLNVHTASDDIARRAGAPTRPYIPKSEANLSSGFGVPATLGAAATVGLGYHLMTRDKK